MWLQIAICLQIILEIIAIYILIKDGQSPIRIWTWILIILVFPILGVVLYVFFGINLRKQKMFDLKKEIDYDQFEKFIDRYSEEAEQKIIMRDDVTTRYIHLIRLLTELIAPLLFNNKVTDTQ